MNDLKDNVTSDAFWLKTIYLIAFLLVYRVLGLIILVISIAQWGFRLLTGNVNASLAEFGEGLGIYVGQIVQYLSGSSEEKPYPFQDWPETKVREE